MINDRETIRAPIPLILPSAMPLILEYGLPGYATEPLKPGERRLEVSDQKALFAAGFLVGVLNTCAEQGFDLERVRPQLQASVGAVTGLTAQEQMRALQLVDHFENYKIIREEHSLDDWMAEALWDLFQSVPYRYPSALSRIIAFALTYRQELERCVIEYGAEP